MDGAQDMKVNEVDGQSKSNDVEKKRSAEQGGDGGEKHATRQQIRKWS